MQSKLKKRSLKPSKKFQTKNLQNDQKTQKTPFKVTQNLVHRMASPSIGSNAFNGLKLKKGYFSYEIVRKSTKNKKNRTFRISVDQCSVEGCLNELDMTNSRQIRSFSTKQIQKMDQKMLLSSPLMSSRDRPSSQAPTSRLKEENLAGIQEVFQKFRNKHTELAVLERKPAKGSFLDDFVMGMIFRAWKNLVVRSC